MIFSNSISHIFLNYFKKVLQILKNTLAVMLQHSEITVFCNVSNTF